MERVSKHNYYLDIAQTVAERSTCLRKKYGAIIVKDDSIISTGCYIGEGASVENSVLMPGTVIENGAIVRHAILGENSKVEMNAVVGGCDKKDISVTSKGAVVKANTVLAAGDML